MTDDAETRARRWGRGGVFGLGLAMGVFVGLAVGPFGAAALGLNLPYLRLTVPEPAAAVPPPSSARNLPVAAASTLGADTPAAAKTSSQPAAPVAASSGAPQPIAPPQGRVLTIGVFGDSLGDGLWQGLYRHLNKADAVEVLRFSKQSTGLTSYDYVDVQEQTRQQLDQHHVDIAVVLFGTNDEQGIVDGGKVYGFGTPGWRAAYGARMQALVELLRARGATVYWVGLPKMEKAEFDRRAGVLNTVLQARAAALGVPFIATVPVTVDETGAYDAYLASPGDTHRQLMRARDGIHMTPAGYFRLAGPVAERIRQDLAAGARRELAAAPPAPGVSPTSAPTPTDRP